jgi:uncharacterized protein YndB with AHSA1/START domain
VKVNVTEVGASTITVPGSTEMTMTRVFDAPRELVFRAWTDPELIPKWWGRYDTTTTVDKMDVTIGGQWRFIQRDAEGNEYAFRGEYREIIPPEWLVYTFEFEGMPGHIAVATLILEDLDGKTKLIDVTKFQSVEERDGALATGMEAGANELLDRLAELLAEL